MLSNPSPHSCPVPGDTLRIVTWNCAMAFRRKWPQLLALRPDIAVIQECETPDRWPAIGASSMLWHGENRNKGLAVVSFGDWRAESAFAAPRDLRYFLPVRIAGRRVFNLLAVWAMGACDLGIGYIYQVQAAVQRYRPWLADAPSVVAGDWNANPLWDRPARSRTPFQGTVRTLHEIGIVSAYHSHRQSQHGSEVDMTYRSSKGVGYHIDYCFVPHAWAICEARVHIDLVPKVSDHAPVIVDLRF